MEGADGSTIAGHGVVGEMSPHHARQPPPLFGDGQMPTSHELVLDLLEFRPQPLRNGVAPEPEAPVLALPADVREPQEVERPWLPEAPCRSALGGVAPELDQPGLVGVQFQAELREPLTEIMEELLGVTLVLEAD